jgi:hypothetical protein
MDNTNDWQRDDLDRDLNWTWIPLIRQERDGARDGNK